MYTPSMSAVNYTKKNKHNELWNIIPDTNDGG